MVAETVPFDPDLRIRMEAWSEGGSAPKIWLPEHVENRMTEAYRVLSRAPFDGAPSRQASGWPGVLVVMAKARDEEIRRALTAKAIDRLVDPVATEEELSRHGTNIERRPPPSAIDLSMMSEALSWPMTYLRDRPVEADAARLFAMSKACGQKTARVLADRRHDAFERAWRASNDREANDPACRHKVLNRRTIAVALAAEYRTTAYQRGIHHRSDREEHDKLRADMRLDFMQRCIDAGCAPTLPSLTEFENRYCLHRWQVDRFRKRAYAAIAAGLKLDEIPIR